jgi:hypothetical protein
MCVYGVWVCVCGGWDFGGDMCGALSANLRVTTEKEGSVFSVCAIFSQENGMFPFFRLFSFLVFAFYVFLLGFSWKTEKCFLWETEKCFLWKTEKCFPASLLVHFE